MSGAGAGARSSFAARAGAAHPPTGAVVADANDGIPPRLGALRANSSSSLYAVSEHEKDDYEAVAGGVYDVIHDNELLFRYVPLTVLDYLSMVRRDW